MSYIEIYMPGTYFERTICYKDAKHDIIHRADGPAIEYKNGDKEWWVDGKRHREDGPAIEYINGMGGLRSYYIRGKIYQEKEYWAIIRLGNFV